ncbi:MAG: LytTR family DNA-binding domain-containing protein [Lachnospiraceae bacterium]|nr:LytTR family DNA-binding domain-containing protein [Lachnospiraceae bacterium]
MIKVAICDDENRIASQIENLILSICMKENIIVDTDVFYCGKSLEKEIVNGTMYDLIYFDIQMKDGDGITTAKSIRRMDENVILIYVSGYDSYVMELFRLDVFAFIKKPIDPKLFTDVFLDACRKIGNKKFYFIYHYKNNEYKIPCIDILYFESRGHKINIHTRNGAVEVFNGKLSDTQTQISRGKIPFLRTHQSFLVNYHHIKSRSKTDVTLTTGTRLPISEDRQKTFGEQYSKLLGDEVHI